METGRDWSVEVDTLIDRMKGYYLHPDMAERVCERYRRRLADGAYRGLSDEEAFAKIVTADAQSVSGDKHLAVKHTVDEVPERPDPVLPEIGRYPREEVELAGHGFVKVERLPGNVGLLDIRRLNDPSVSGTAAVAAMNLVAGSDVLLIDLRRNTGGEPAMNALLCSFLFDERTQLSTLCFPADNSTLQYWTEPFVPGPVFGGSKPIYVLISADTLSGGEGLSYDLQQLKRATLVGETTAGAANFGFRYRVSGHLVFHVPSGYPVNPVSGTHWEGVGVRPDIAVGAERALDTAYRLALEHVLGLGAQGGRREVAEQARLALAELDTSLPGWPEPLTEERIRAATIGEAPVLDGTIVLSDYDPEWPRLYQREADRVRSLLGDRIVRLEHTGSTSVPGLAAKPIIDMLLIVADSSDEPSYVPDMEAAGYVLRIREPDWHEHRVFKGPDTNVNLHVLSEGSPEIDRVLAFRDRLRSDDADRELYERTKRALAARRWKYVQNYADAKTAVVEQIIARAGGSGSGTTWRPKR